MRRAYLLAFALGTALAGAAGTLVSVGYSVSPSIGLEWTLKALIVVVLAGLGSMLGTFAAGLLLGVAEALSAAAFGGPYREVVGLVIFLVVLVLRPAGPVRAVSRDDARHERRVDARHPRSALGAARPSCRCSVRRDDVLNFVFLVLLSITLAQSWNIIAGYAGQVNLGHAAFFGLGALTARTLWIAGAPILLAMAAGARGGRRLRAADRRAPPSACAAPTSRSARWPWARSSGRPSATPCPRSPRCPAASIAGYRLAPRYYLALALAALSVLAVAGARRLAPRARHAGDPRGRGRGGGHRRGRAAR